MTEKRFRISQGYSDKFCHDWAKNKLLNFRQTVDLLNNLNDENEQLKSELSEKDIQLDFLKSENIHISDLVNENKELKQKLKIIEALCNNKEYIKEIVAGERLE